MPQRGNAVPPTPQLTTRGALPPRRVTQSRCAQQTGCAAALPSPLCRATPRALSLSCAAMADASQPRQRSKRGEAILAKQEAEAARKKKVEEEYAAKLEAENKRKRQNDAKTVKKHAAFYENTASKKIMCLAGPKKDGLWHPDSKKLRAEFEASAAASKPRKRLEKNREATKARKRTGKQAPPPRRIAAPPPPPPKKPSSKPSSRPSSKKPAGRQPLAQLSQDEAPRAQQQARAPKKCGAACDAPGAARQQSKKPASEPSWAQPLRILQRVNESTAASLKVLRFAPDSLVDFHIGSLPLRSSRTPTNATCGNL